jgi:hypothetical protein
MLSATRSLADFAKLVETFDEHEVSFVSETVAPPLAHVPGPESPAGALRSYDDIATTATGQPIESAILQ